jgi:hypothetical protein
MNDTPTPETDKLLTYQYHKCVPFWDRGGQLAKLSCKLERERDEARRDLSTLIYEILKKDGVSVFDMSVMDRLAELHRNEIKSKN